MKSKRSDDLEFGIQRPDEIMAVHTDNDTVRKVAPKSAVRRQGFWDNWRPDLVEALAHQGFHSKRRLCDAASAVD